jgi:DNA adenine methylase
VLRYHGGKYRIAPRIIACLYSVAPKHRVYVEPFGGAASVLMRKPRSDFEVYNDLDSDVVNVFRVLRDRGQAAELQRLLKLTPWARAEFEGSYDATDDDVERARRTIVRCFMAHGSTSRRRGRTGFRAASHPGRRGGGFGDWRGYHDALPAFVDRLHGVVIECRPAMDIIERHDAVDALFYVDPPYPISTRSSIRCDGDSDRAYSHEMTDDDHRCIAASLHRCIAASLHRCIAAVVVSGYACQLYDEELYAGWERLEIKARADGGKDRTEVVWCKPAGATSARPTSLVQSSLGL